MKTVLFTIFKCLFVYVVFNSCTRQLNDMADSSKTIEYYRSFPISTDGKIYLDSIHINDSNLIIDGGNYTYVFNSFGGQLKILGKNIVLKNFKFDYKIIPRSEGQITKIAGDTMVVKYLRGIPFDTSLYDKCAKIYGLFRTQDFKLVPNIENQYSYKDVPIKKLNDSLYEIIKRNFFTSALGITVGMYFIKDPSANPDFKPIVEIINTENIRLENVTIYSSSEVAITSELSSNLIIDNCKIIPNPNNGSLLSSNRDGINISLPISNYNIGPFITNSVISNCGDDGINIRNIVFYASSITDSSFIGFTTFQKSSIQNSLNTRSINKIFGKIGDTIEFYTESGRPIVYDTPNIILQIEPRENFTFYIKTNRRLPATFTTKGWMVNFSQSGNQKDWTIINNTLVTQTRRIGVLMLSLKSLITNNMIINNPSIGIYATNTNINNIQNLAGGFSNPCICLNYDNIIQGSNLQLDKFLNNNTSQQLFELYCPLN